MTSDIELHAPIASNIKIPAAQHQHSSDHTAVCLEGDHQRKIRPRPGETLDCRESSNCLKSKHESGLSGSHREYGQLKFAAELATLSSLRMVKQKSSRGLEKPKSEYVSQEVMLPGAEVRFVVAAGQILVNKESFGKMFTDASGVYIWCALLRLVLSPDIDVILV